jgi:hypothetical protein
VLASDVTKGRCPVCRAPSCGCGPDSSDIEPIDQPIRGEEPAMADLKEYQVTINGETTTMQLNEADAERLGGKPVGTKQATSKNKKRTTKDEG